METSCFAPVGLLRLSSKPPAARLIYEQLQQLLSAGQYVGAQYFDFTVGGHLEAWCFATARGLARHLGYLERAGNQVYPMRCLELLPLLELDFQLRPGPRDDYIARQKALAAAEVLSQGYRLGNVLSGLQNLLGSAFIAYVPAPSRTTYPASPGNGPGNFVDVRVPPRFLQLVDPVVQTGAPVWCAYQNWDTTIPPVALNKGDVVVVGAGNTAQQEKITVAAVANVPPAGSNATANAAPAGAVTWTPNTQFYVGQYVTPTAANANGFWFRATTNGTTGTTEPLWPGQFGVQVTDNGVSWIAAGASTVFQATFTNSHDVGAPVITGTFPYWFSTQRFAYVVVTATAASDPPTRAKIDAFMGKLARGPSQWAIVAATPTTGTNGGTLGPLSAGVGMGTVPITQQSYTNG